MSGLSPRARLCSRNPSGRTGTENPDTPVSSWIDPDGYVWELAYAPALRIGEDNRLLPTTKAEAAAGKDT